jgi:hypothetical protein
MKKKISVKLICTTTILFYLFTIGTSCYMIHNRHSNKKETIETKTIKEEVENLFNYPDLSLYAKH